MILVKISRQVFEQNLQGGNTYHLKIEQGIPDHCKLEIVRFDGEIVSFYFAEGTEEVKEQEIVVHNILEVK